MNQCRATGLLLAGALVIALITNANGNEQSIAASGTKHITAAGFSQLPAGGELPKVWEPLRISSIPRNTLYSLESADGVTVLRAEADASMSGLAREIDLDPQALPWMQWRWRVAGANEKSRLDNKQGDDFPARIYVFFDYDINRMPFLERVIFRLARALYGDRLPRAALCYVWANEDPPGTTAWNAFTERVRMVVASSGNAQAGQWVAVERNVGDDFKEAFGEPVPRITGIAIATDSDGTGEYSLAWYGDIVFSSQERGRE